MHRTKTSSESKCGAPSVCLHKVIFHLISSQKVKTGHFVPNLRAGDSPGKQHEIGPVNDFLMGTHEKGGFNSFMLFMLAFERKMSVFQNLSINYEFQFQ